MLDTREPDDAEPRGKPRRAGLAVLGIPALAAVLALVLRWSTPMGDLVTYELEIIAPKAPVASAAPADEAAPASVTIEPGQPLKLQLRPRRPFADPVEARAFVELQPGSLQREPIPFVAEAAPASPGALFISIDGRQLPARCRVMILIGRPGSIPSIPAGTASHGRDWQRFDIDVDQSSSAP